MDDGSDDATGVLLDGLAMNHPNVRVAHHTRCEGTGPAILTGARCATHPWVLVCPVDQPLDAVTLQRFAGAREGVDVVVGYRTRRLGYSWWMRFASSAYRVMLGWLFGRRLRDWTWISCYRTEWLRQVPTHSRRIAFFPEVLARAIAQGARLTEVQCEMHPRRVGRATASRLGAITQNAADTLWVCWDLRRTLGGPRGLRP